MENTGNIKVVLPDHEQIRILRERLLSVLSSRPWHWLSPSERKWLEELQDDED